MEPWGLALLAFVGGTLFGAGLVYIISRVNAHQRQTYEEKLLESVKGSFSTMSNEALQQSQTSFLQLAEERLHRQTTQHTGELDTKKQLIDERLNQVKSELSKVEDLVRTFERERDAKLGALDRELHNLTDVSTKLQRVLADNRTRGAWGERIADDILRMVGLIENVNYTRQQTTANGKRPDYTFNLPNGLVINMDVKFPLDNFSAYIEATSDADKERNRKQFLTDVRSRIKEVEKRGYISPEDQTVDLALLFIPNEQIFRFIHEEDPSIINDALEKKIVVCSPLTLFIVLAVVRQAAQNFQLEQSSREILQRLGAIKKQWEQFTETMDKIGSSLEKAQSAYEDTMGVRKRQLDKEFSGIDALLETSASDSLPASSQIDE